MPMLPMNPRLGDMFGRAPKPPSRLALSQALSAGQPPQVEQAPSQEPQDDPAARKKALREAIRQQMIALREDSMEAQQNRIQADE